MRVSAKFRIALGQASLVTSIVLAAAFFGLVPDRVTAVREGRAALAEVLSVNSTILISSSELRALRSQLRLAVDRNPDLLSAALRSNDGNLVVSVGEHEGRWLLIPGEFSTDSQVRVPIMDGREKWGQIELRFRPLAAEGLLALVDNPWVKLVGFIGLLSFIAFYIYLGKMLKQLDPSQAVPSRVRSALDTMAEGLLVLDRRENIVLANTAFATLLGETPEKLTGRRASVFGWTDPDGKRLAQGEHPWITALEEGALQRSRKLKLELENGTIRTFMVNCSPVLGADGKGGGVMVSLDDITQLEEQEVALRDSKAKADEANQAKSDFLANMSHEIRTPMNAILGFTEVLKRGYDEDPEENRRHLNTIHASGQHLLNLINDILDLSKVESGKMEVENTNCAPHVVILETLRIFEARAAEKGIYLKFEADGELPERIVSDPGRLRQVITNVVGNAIKFTEEGGVTVAARVFDDGFGTKLGIDITDTGVGMEQSQCEKIFDPFAQADESITRKFGGTGLGLAISRRFARALGGDIVATSSPGEGSTFHIVIEAGSLEGVAMLSADQLVLDDAGAPGDAGEMEWEFPEVRVLVVDDGVDNRALIRLVLGKIGLTVEEAENGQEGLDRASSESFDIILMDIQMPVMDGETATRALRERGVQIPIIALTGNAMKGYEETLLDAGFTGYMTKPIDIDRLLAELAGRLGAKQVPKAAPAKAPSAKSPSAKSPSAAAPEPEPVAAVDDSPIHSRMLALSPMFKPIVVKFVGRLDGEVDAMEAALAQDDRETLAKLVDWAKEAGKGAGFDPVVEVAKVLEEQVKSVDDDGTAASLHELRALAARLVSPDAPPPPAQTEAAPVAAAGGGAS